MLLSVRLARLSCVQCRRASRLRSTADRAVVWYNDVIGITEVTRAKDDVISCEAALSEAQLQRRQKQFELRKLQNRLKEIHGELDRTPRGNDRWLHLVTEEHAAIKQERALMDEFEVFENREREAFHQLSNKVRISHEKEREREERTKYWSISASLIGAMLGIIGATISNEVRMRNIRKMIPLGQDVREVFNENAEITKQLQELKRLTALDQALDKDPNAVVYVGDEMEVLLRRTEENIESKMKLQTLVLVVFAYGVVGVAAPLLYLWYTGSV
ncbi:Coiled-coil domain-containing protein 51-like, protein [Aphelenchoides fujianensis]|nr:Coiled-coil domain-containing protein 51-like, protein [Aphelenchoides fujianensis]